MDADTQIKIREMGELLRLAQRLAKAAEYALPDRIQVVIETFESGGGNGQVKLEFLHEMKISSNQEVLEFLRERLVGALYDASNMADNMANELLKEVKA